MKKCIKLIICIFLCISILLSVCLVEHNAWHNCVGEECQVCRDIALQREILKSVLLCVLCGGAILSVSQLTAFIALFVDTEKRKLNLVANKVKLTA